MRTSGWLLVVAGFCVLASKGSVFQKRFHLAPLAGLGAVVGGVLVLDLGWRSDID